MLYSDKTYSVLLVSASESFNRSFFPLLPVSRYYPVTQVSDLRAARESTPSDLVIVNAPLPGGDSLSYCSSVADSTLQGSSTFAGTGWGKSPVSMLPNFFQRNHPPTARAAMTRRVTRMRMTVFQGKCFPAGCSTGEPPAEPSGAPPSGPVLVPSAPAEASAPAASAASVPAAPVSVAEPD